VARLPATVERPGPGQPIAKFAYGYCRHTKGRWAGTPILYEGWQRDFWDETFLVGSDGKRVYREVLNGRPRKNAKSTEASVFGLYMLGLDGEDGPEVYSLAAAKSQAGITLNQGRAMVRHSPELQQWFRVRQYHVECPDNDGIWKVISADAPLQHGTNPSANIIDEYWAHRTADLYEAMTTGSGAREEPLTVTLTTAGWDLESPLGQLFQRVMVLPEVERRDHLTIGRDRENGFLMWWYGASEEDDLEDPRVWMACNPASWITEDFLRRERNKPTMRPEVFYQLYLNFWNRVVASFLPAGAWKAAEDPELFCSCSPACMPGTCLGGFASDLPLAVAIDVALKNDSTAVTMAQRQGDRVVERTRVWQNPYRPNDPLHAFWQTPLEDVKDHLRWLYHEFPRPAAEIDGEVKPGPRFGFDPMYFGNEARELAGEGLAMEQVPQTDARMVPASETFYRLIMEKLPDGRRGLGHDADPIVAQQIGNAIMDRKGYGRWRLTRPRGSSVKIDAAVSGAIGAWLALQPVPEPPKPKKRQLVFVH
jgi:phage terminase large subunit-like protein